MGLNMKYDADSFRAENQEEIIRREAVISQESVFKRYTSPRGITNRPCRFSTVFRTIPTIIWILSQESRMTQADGSAFSVRF